MDAITETTDDQPALSVSPPTPWDSSSIAGLRDIMREDITTYATGPFYPALHMILVHRFGVWASDAAGGWARRVAARQIYKLVNAVYIRNVLGFEVSSETKIGRRVRFVHQGGVVLQPGAEIGDDSMVYHGVTLGRRWEEYHDSEYHQPPKLGRGVHVGVGAVIIGAVRVGDGAKVGPNAVVTKDVPAGASVVAPATRTLRLR